MSLNPTVVKIVIPILLVSLLWVYFVPASNAQFAGLLTCAGGGILTSLINTGISSLTNWLGSFFGGVFGGATQVPVNEGFLRAKDSIEDVIVRCAATQIYGALNTAVATIVRSSGRLGGPAFVRNWRNFQTDAEYRGENIFRSILSGTTLCPH